MKSRKALFLALGLTVFGGIWFYFGRPRSLEEHSTIVANRYINGDVRGILDNRTQQEKQNIPSSDRLESELLRIFQRVRMKFTVTSIVQVKGSQSLAQAHSNVKCLSNIHGGEFTLIAPCHLTPDGVRSPLSYFIKFLWLAEYLSETKLPRKDIPEQLEANFLGIQRDAETLNQAGLTQVSGDGLKFYPMSGYLANVTKLRNLFLEAASKKR